MKKYIFLVLLYVCANTHAYAQVIIMGSHGGPTAYNFLGLFGTGKGYNYDPLRSFVQTSEQVLTSSGVMPAVPIALRNEVNVVSRISGDTSDTEDMADWFADTYQPGDKIILIGYSAGGKFVVNLAEALSGYTINAMFLVDPFVDAGSDEIPSNVERVAVYHQKTWHRLIRESKGLVGFESYHEQGPVNYFPNHPAKLCELHHANIDNARVVYDDILAKILGLTNGSIHSSNIGNNACYRKFGDILAEWAGDAWQNLKELILLLNPTLEAWASGGDIDEYEADVTVHETVNQVDIEFADNPGVIYSVHMQTLPEPVVGPEPDFHPDYDVFIDSDLDTEVSASHDDQPAKEVLAGATLWHRLAVEVHNSDVESEHIRNGRSESIDGTIKCRVVGHTSWTELPGADDELEYDIDNLHEGAESDEVITSVVPDYPGSVLECRAWVDTDDEVDEESESNNRSRTERFLIADPHPPVGYLDYVSCNIVDGWAGDWGINAPINVRIRIDGVIVFDENADVYRSDLASTDWPSANHGFEFDVPISLKSPDVEHTVTAHAVDSQTGIEHELTHSPTSYVCDAYATSPCAKAGFSKTECVNNVLMPSLQLILGD